MKVKRVPRNPFVALAKFRRAGFHTKPIKSSRRQEKQALAKIANELPVSWHKRISLEARSEVHESHRRWNPPAGPHS
ncbi:MAG: hypothetical protein EBX30_14030 [Betaproteobacteria bacterium]|nr:hypothetical protein [Betaproteobacteria bacterium]